MQIACVFGSIGNSSLSAVGWKLCGPTFSGGDAYKGTRFLPMWGKDSNFSGTPGLESKKVPQFNISIFFGEMAFSQGKYRTYSIADFFPVTEVLCGTIKRERKIPLLTICSSYSKATYNLLK